MSFDGDLSIFPAETGCGGFAIQFGTVFATIMA